MEVDDDNVTLPRIVFPGDRVPEAEVLNKQRRKVVVGPGLTINDGQIKSMRAGILKARNPGIFYVDSYLKRYVPTRGESVVGVVSARLGDFYRVDIGTSEQASLSYLAFEGATKKNRPDVNVGDAIFAKILIANKDLEPELVCMDSHGKKARMGVLSDGFVFSCSLNLIRKILVEDCPLLNALKNEMHYECAIGMNGRIWVRAKTVKETIAVSNAILAAEYLSGKEIVKMCEKIGRIMSGMA